MPVSENSIIFSVCRHEVAVDIVPIFTFCQTCHIALWLFCLQINNLRHMNIHNSAEYIIRRKYETFEK